ncbi:MAG: glutathione S-transferase family protein [Gammaproteobacteria bacterium]
MDDIILHHYDASPYSEKVRLVLGLKGLPWKSVIIPYMLPKPSYTPLTGGYRKTPSMQIGADVYCDSQCIIRELERRFPEPTLFPDGGAGLPYALAAWSDKVFYEAAVPVILGTIGERVSKAFLQDREQMRGTAFDLARMRAAVPVMREQLRALGDLISAQLQDGRPYLLGERPGLADVQAYFSPWFLRLHVPQEAEILDALPGVAEWESRVRAIGHGTRVELDAADALAIAKDAGPDTLPEEDPGEPGGIKPGDRVEVAPDDYGRDFVKGELISSSPQEIAILRRDHELGEIVVHFPRAGFVVAKRRASARGARRSERRA